MKRRLIDYLMLLIPAAIIVFLDQWTKWLVTTNLAYGEVWAPWHWLLPYARIVHFSNTGAAFGLFQRFGSLFGVLAILVSIFIVYYYPQVDRKDWLIRLALTMQLAGAVGNLVDRLQQGHVTDFISVGSFAVFNVADACISVGTVILLIGMYFHDKREQLVVQDEVENSGEEFTQTAQEDHRGE